MSALLRRAALDNQEGVIGYLLGLKSVEGELIGAFLDSRLREEKNYYGGHE
jgi:hypothetical protein